MTKMTKTRTKGVWQRRDHYYMRKREGTRVRWVSLGDNYEKARKRHRSHLDGAPVVRRLTVERATEDWLTVKVPTRRNEKGVTLARARIEAHFIPFFRGRQLSKIEKDDIRRYRTHLEKKGLTSQTVVHVLSDARAFFGWCCDTDRLPRSPFPRGVLPRVQETAPDRLTEKEVETLVAMPDPYGFVIRFLLGTGLRWAEACRAVAHRRGPEDTVFVEDGSVVVSHTKTGRVRRVPLAEGLLAEVRTRIGPLVPYSASNPAAFARLVRRRTGLEGFHVHQCRHTFACEWIAQSGSLAALQQILGHSTVVTTQRYARLSDAAVRDEAKRLHEGSAEG